MTDAPCKTNKTDGRVRVVRFCNDPVPVYGGNWCEGTEIAEIGCNETTSEGKFINVAIYSNEPHICWFLNKLLPITKHYFE